MQASDGTEVTINTPLCHAGEHGWRREPRKAPAVQVHDGRIIQWAAKSEDFLFMAHRVISVRRGIWLLPGHNGHWSSRTNQAQFMSTSPSSA